MTKKTRSLVLTLEEGLRGNYRAENGKKKMRVLQNARTMCPGWGKGSSDDDAKFRVNTASGSFIKPDTCLVNRQDMAEYLQV